MQLSRIKGSVDLAIVHIYKLAQSFSIAPAQIYHGFSKLGPLMGYCVFRVCIAESSGTSTEIWGALCLICFRPAPEQTRTAHLYHIWADPQWR